MVMIDMEMPESCYDCMASFCCDSGLVCGLYEAINDAYIFVEGCNQKRHEKCPLIEAADFCPIMADDCK